jgi:hypothetical protein
MRCKGGHPIYIALSENNLDYSSKLKLLSSTLKES